MDMAQDILKELQNRVDEMEYKRYISQLIYIKELSRDDFLTFSAPNIFIAKWVESNYKELITQAFNEKMGINPKIEIEVARGKYQKDIQDSILPKGVKNLQLNPSFTFDSFIVGESNQFAYTTAKSVAKKPGRQYNPLFLYGGVGLGKTHLLQAIGNYRTKCGDRVIYTTLEQFMNQYISHIKSQSMDSFREQFRECDLLLIDDIQFLSQKEQTQEEFFHTFNELHSAGKQIVLTSDRQPNKIKGLVDRLRSRFEWGLMADIQPPGLETKIEIIKKKCELDGIHLDRDIIHYIATRMGDNIREIEGIIIKINAMSTMLNQPLTLEFAKSAIKEQLKEEQKSITIDDIVKIVSSELNVKPSDIRSKKRARNVVNARRIVIYLARNLTPNSMPQIALYFGMKDHTTISHAMRKIKEVVDKDEKFKLLLEELSHRVGSIPKKTV